MSKKRGKTLIAFVPIIIVMVTFMFFFINALHSQQNQPQVQRAQSSQTAHTSVAVVKKTKSSSGKFYAAAIAVAVSCLAAGIAVGQVGSSAIGAISEKPELFGRALTFVGLAEGIAIWGLIIAILILNA